MRNVSLERGVHVIEYHGATLSVLLHPHEHQRILKLSDFGVESLPRGFDDVNLLSSLRSPKGTLAPPGCLH